MKRILFLIFLSSFLMTNLRSQAKESQTDRAYWSSMAYKVALPVLENLSQNKLKKNMPIEEQHNVDRSSFAHLEAMGRLLCGIAPWLELPQNNSDEGKMRSKLTILAQKGLHNMFDPNSPDYMNFTKGSQPLVDAAFLAQAFIRAPHALWDPLDKETKKMVLKGLRETTKLYPQNCNNNWLLFPATIEAFFLSVGEEYDQMRIDFAIRKHLDWYKGDGVYGDGPNYHWDYYNSYVIQPMLLDVVTVLKENHKISKESYALIDKRSVRYAQIQEKLISPEGTYPVFGRSQAYRMGAFQTLSMMALRKELPKEIDPAQVRCALTAVMKRQMEAPGTFDSKGWLQIGVCGHQPHAGEGYICTGSLYLCSAVFLPLGLPEEDPFWSNASANWSSKRLWNHEEIYTDHALYQ